MDDDDLSSPSRRDTVISQSKLREMENTLSWRKRLREHSVAKKNVHIHFVGVWSVFLRVSHHYIEPSVFPRFRDTVFSVGFDRNKTFLYTTSSCDHICYFRHALALDERRVKFLPEYVYGGRSSVVRCWMTNVSKRSGLRALAETCESSSTDRPGGPNSNSDTSKWRR